MTTVPGPAPAPGPVDLLVVCRANVARSPLLAARLRHEADRRIGPGTVDVGSAGTSARLGDPAAAGAQRVAARWGLSLADHASRALVHATVHPDTLILTATRRQATTVVTLLGGPHRTFTVPELVHAIDRLRRAGRLAELPPGRVDAATVRRHVAAVCSAAATVRPRVRRRSLDVPDPIGGDRDVFDRLGKRFDREALVLAEALFGPAAR